MSLFAWLLLGLLAGFIASHLVNHRGEGMVLDILLGIVGAIVGGWVFHMLGLTGINRLNLYSLLIALIGSVL
ncbi:MAG TPA: GlsB/YeaQ/YmgE family stress response membrane protein, partial [Bryobacteraceae bacterium]|nr:GlsB/YeaQ/YmgE family stress response membrane protein [Bryobacteraceae bacterium]